MEARAEAKYVRVSPRKVNYICKEIRGKQVDEALTILHFTPKKGAFGDCQCRKQHELGSRDVGGQPGVGK